MAIDSYLTKEQKIREIKNLRQNYFLALQAKKREKYQMAIDYLQDVIISAGLLEKKCDKVTSRKLGFGLMIRKAQAYQLSAYLYLIPEAHTQEGRMEIASKMEEIVEGRVDYNNPKVKF